MGENHLFSQSEDPELMKVESHSTGPISATAVPTGTALSRLLALTDALTFALEVS